MLAGEETHLKEVSVKIMACKCLAFWLVLKFKKKQKKPSRGLFHHSFIYSLTVSSYQMLISTLDLSQKPEKGSNANIQINHSNYCKNKVMFAVTLNSINKITREKLSSSLKIFT